MSTHDEMCSHLLSLGVTAGGVQYVINSAVAPPSRKVRSGKGKNLTGERSTRLRTTLETESASSSIGRLQFESQSVEFAFLAQLEYENEASLVLDQPLAIPLTILNRSGRTQRISYTPDFLVVTACDAYVVQTKKEEEAAQLIKERPQSWFISEGHYHYVQADSYFEAIGLRHVVVTDSDCPWMLVQNYELLGRPEIRNLCLSDVAKRQICRVVQKRGPSCIREIYEACNFTNALPVLRAIQERIIYASLKHANLADPMSRFVCATDDEATYVGLGLASVQKTTMPGADVTVDDTFDPKHLEELGRRLAVVTGQVDPGGDVPCRTVQNWKKLYREGGACALAPKWHRSGTKGPRITPWHQDVVRTQIQKDRSSDCLVSRKQSWIAYKLALSGDDNDGSTPISYTHYTRLWSQRRHNAGDARGVGGDRLANEEAPHIGVDSRIPFATRPFQVAHIDHCFAPTYVTHGGTPSNEGHRLPILTALVDDWLSEPIAWIVRTEPPSATSDLLLLRDCVRRHGRLPESIVSDGGPDFRGNVFTAALANYEVHWINRPPKNPRTGHVVERTFGTFADAVCRGSRGYVPNWKRMRSISPEKRPLNRPRRAYEEFVEHSNHVLGQVIPNLPRDDGRPCARAQRLEYEVLYGLQGRPVNFDLRFLIVTSPPIDAKGHVEPSGAFRIPAGRYYCPALVGYDCLLSSLSARLDCEDPTVAYLLVRGTWQIAKSSDAMRQRGRTDQSIAADRASTKRDTSAKAERDHMLHQRTAEANCAIDATPEVACSEAPDEISPSKLETSRTSPPAKPLCEALDWLIARPLTQRN